MRLRKMTHRRGAGPRNGSSRRSSACVRVGRSIQTHGRGEIAWPCCCRLMSTTRQFHCAVATPVWEVCRVVNMGLGWLWGVSSIFLTNTRFPRLFLGQP